jgi:hypothetical protein
MPAIVLLIRLATIVANAASSMQNLYCHSGNTGEEGNLFLHAV